MTSEPKALWEKFYPVLKSYPYSSATDESISKDLAEIAEQHFQEQVQASEPTSELRILKNALNVIADIFEEASRNYGRKPMQILLDERSKHWDRLDNVRTDLITLLENKK